MKREEYGPLWFRLTCEITKRKSPGVDVDSTRYEDFSAEDQETITETMERFLAAALPVDLDDAMETIPLGKSAEYRNGWVDAVSHLRHLAALPVEERPGQHTNIAKDARCPTCNSRMAVFPDKLWRCPKCAPVEEQGPRPVDTELVRMGHAYFSCQMLIGQLRKLAESHARYWDRFEACLFCKNHIDKGHVEGCLLVESQKAVLRFDDEQKRIVAASRPKAEEGKEVDRG